MFELQNVFQSFQFGFSVVVRFQLPPGETTTRPGANKAMMRKNEERNQQYEQ